MRLLYKPFFKLVPMLLLAPCSLAFGSNTDPLASVKRIISLAPSSTELVYAAGLGNKLVAVSEHSDYPPEAQKLERVASYNSVNIERIVDLKPDLIVAWRSGGSIKALNQLQSLGYRIYYSDTDTLEDIATRVEELGKLANQPSQAQASSQQFRERLKELREKYPFKDSVSYFYQLSSQPIYTMANSRWPSEVFAFCGGVNIFTDSPAPYPQVGFEQVIAKAPEVIFTSSHAIQNTQMWQKWDKQIPAVANKQIWSLTSDWINRPTPRSLLAVEEVCKYLDKARQSNQNHG